MELPSWPECSLSPEPGVLKFGSGHRAEKSLKKAQLAACRVEMRSSKAQETQESRRAFHTALCRKGSHHGGKASVNSVLLCAQQSLNNPQVMRNPQPLLTQPGTCPLRKHPISLVWDTQPCNEQFGASDGRLFLTMGLVM